MENKKELIIQMFMEELQFQHSVGDCILFGETSNLDHLKAVNIILKNINEKKCKFEIINLTTGEKKYKTIRNIKTLDFHADRVVKNEKVFYLVNFEIEEVENGKEL